MFFNATMVISTFFINNAHIISKGIEDNGRIIACSKEGILLGEKIEKGGWIYFKTFVSNDLKKQDQHEMEDKLLNDLQRMLNKLSLTELDRLYGELILRSLAR